MPPVLTLLKEYQPGIENAQQYPAKYQSEDTADIACPGLFQLSAVKNVGKIVEN
jgi:hypothetical protein